jgi:hypothetical protein
MEILLYYKNRGVGHTELLQYGIFGTDCIIVAHNTKAAFQIAGTKGISMKDFSVKTKGIRKPLGFDNEALYIIFQKSLSEIDRLTTIIEGMKERQLLE